jgi:pilus assembly protein CpaE
MSTIRVLLVHDRDHIADNLIRLIQFDKDIEVVGRARTGAEAIRQVKEHGPHVVLMDITLPDMSGFEATRLVKANNLAVQVVLLANELDIETFQQGMMVQATDVLSQPPDAGSLYAAIRRAHAIYQEVLPRTGPLNLPPEPLPARPVGHSVAVYSGKGGVGCTTLATNLAITLHNKEKPAVLVDADLQFGDIPVFLNMSPTHSIADLLVGEGKLDTELLDQVLLTHDTGLRLLAAPTAISLAEQITPDHMRLILGELRNRFGWTVVDTPSELNDLSLGILEEADVIVHILTPDIPSVKRATVFFDVVGMIGIPADKVLLVLNQAEARRGIGASTIGATLKREIAVEIAYDRAAILEAINRGEALVVSGKTRPFTRGIYELVGNIRQAVEAGAEALTDGG